MEYTQESDEKLQLHYVPSLIDYITTYYYQETTRGAIIDIRLNLYTT